MQHTKLTRLNVLPAAHSLLTDIEKLLKYSNDYDMNKLFISYTERKMRLGPNGSSLNLRLPVAWVTRGVSSSDPALIIIMDPEYSPLKVNSHAFYITGANTVNQRYGNVPTYCKMHVTLPVFLSESRR